jgi:hypothetical protein
VQSGAVRVAEATRRGQLAQAVRADVDPYAIGNLLAMLALGVIAAVDTGIPVDAPTARATVLRLLGARGATVRRLRGAPTGKTRNT